MENPLKFCWAKNLYNQLKTKLIALNFGLIVFISNILLRSILIFKPYFRLYLFSKFINEISKVKKFAIKPLKSIKLNRYISTKLI